MFGSFNLVPDPRDTEATPPMHPEPKPKYVARPPDFMKVSKEEARPCYLCGYACVEYAKYSEYGLFMHWSCWNSASTKIFKR